MPKRPEPWIERTIREAADAGEFDDLPGAGKPIPDIDHPYDAAWWVRRWFEKNRDLDRQVEVAAEVQRRLPSVMAQESEADVRDGLEELNAFIAQSPGNAEQLPIDEMLDGWRDRRGKQRGRRV